MPRRNRRIVTVVCLALVAVLVGLEVVGLMSDARQTRGVITVAECFFSSANAHGSTYDCFGSFVADKGPIGHGFAPDIVNFTNDGNLATGAKVAARVSGPDDKNATEASESRFRLYLTGGFSVLFLLIPVSFWYDGWKKRRQQATDAAAGETGTH